MKSKLLWFGIASLFIANACVTPPQIKEDPSNPGGGGGTTSTCDKDSVYFANDIFPIFANSCAYAGCHDSKTAEEGVILDSYVNIMSTGGVVRGRPDKSDVFEVLLETDPDKLMPYRLPKLPDSQIELIRKWILQGALNNECKNQCDTVNVSYTKNIKGILEKNCNSCHSGASPSGGVNLSSYGAVKPLALNGSLYGVVSFQSGYKPMPSGGIKIPDCSINQIKIWALNGAPEN